MNFWSLQNVLIFVRVCLICISFQFHYRFNIEDVFCPNLKFKIIQKNFGVFQIIWETGNPFFILGLSFVVWTEIYIPGIEIKVRFNGLKRARKSQTVRFSSVSMRSNTNISAVDIFFWSYWEFTFFREKWLIINKFGKKFRKA